MDKGDKLKIMITSLVGVIILSVLIIFLLFKGNSATDSVTVTMGDDPSLLNSVNEAALEASAGDSADSATEATSITSDSNANASDGAGTDSSEQSNVATTESTVEAVQTEYVPGNEFYIISSADMTNLYDGVQFDSKAQLAELMSYWEQGSGEALEDLMALERFEAMSYSLNGTDSFYYYGEVDSDGQPNGTGIACYANDQYYYGGWENGLRSGQGEWFSCYPAYLATDNVTAFHIYSGSWAHDLPNGYGQENVEYNSELLNDRYLYFQNVIGTFSEGLYNGEMYIMLMDSNTNVTEWYGTAVNGSFQLLGHADADTAVPILYGAYDQEQRITVYPECAQNCRVNGLNVSGSAIVLE